MTSEQSTELAFPLPELAGNLSLLENVPVVVYIAEFNERSTIRYVTPRIEALTGRTPQELLDDGEEWYRCIHPDDVARVRARERECFRTESNFDCEYRVVHRDGTVSHVWERDVVLPGPGSGPRFSQGVLLDVTSLRSTEAELRAEHDRAQRYLDLAGTALMAVDLDGRIAMLNRAGHEMLGYPDGALVGRDFFEACVPEDERPERYERYRTNLTATEPIPEYENRILGSDGGSRLVNWHTTVLREGGEVVGLLTSGTDVTERREAQAQIAHMAYHDSLTGLPNRAMLRDHLELALARAMRQGHSVALLYLDLDDFKLVNDGLGHAAGDDLLKMMSDRLRVRLREQDLVAREGGDEFLILLADLDEDPEQRARAVGESLVEALRAPVQLAGTEFEVNGSIGISIFPRDASGPEELLANADAAMYDAKAAGRGQVHVFRGDRRRSVERLSLGRRLRRAIELDELELHWQPIIRLEDGVLQGAEALVRWQDPERGLLTAGDFIEDVEAAGLIDQLDAWVVAAFTAQRRAWNAQGLDPHVGFNLGPRALRAHRVEPLLEALAASELDLSRVTIEVSETEALHDDAGAREALRRLDSAGVTLALDDFGVAYSSLRRLRDLPTKWIKIDRSFVVGVPGNAGATSVLDAILALLAALEVRVIVEGVESVSQCNWLRERGCEAAQGWFLGRPLPAEQLEAMLRASPESQLSALTAPPRSAAPRD
jgi:diguanylate cyclase (GGDEF)-like protein/PAS domain S-box-containing protein